MATTQITNRGYFLPSAEIAANAGVSRRVDMRLLDSCDKHRNEGRRGALVPQENVERLGAPARTATKERGRMGGDPRPSPSAP